MKQAQVLTERDRKRVMALVSPSPFAERNRCALRLNWLAGMRVGEIAALNVGDVLNSDGSVRSEIQLTASQTKGNKGRTVLLNAQAQAEITIYVRTLKDATQYDPLFRSRVNKRFSANSLCQVFLRIYDQAGLEKATSHSGRRSSGSGRVGRTSVNFDHAALHRAERERAAGGGGVGLSTLPCYRLPQRYARRTANFPGVSLSGFSIWLLH